MEANMGLGAILGVGSALIGASSASKAADAQTQAADKQAALARETRDLTRADLSPWVNGGQKANEAYLYEMGLGAAPMTGGTAQAVESYSIPGTGGYGAGQTWMPDLGGGEGRWDMTPGSPGTAATTGYRVGTNEFATMDAAQKYANANTTGGTAYGGYTKTPGYDFRLQQGQDSLDASAASRGGLFSGASMKAATQYGQDYATGEYGNYMNRLAGLSSSGQNGAAGLAAANQNYSTQAGNAFASMGNAQAAGAIGVGNAIQGGINNGVGMWQYQNTLAGQGGGTPLNNKGGDNWLFGGNSWG